MRALIVSLKYAEQEWKKSVEIGYTIFYTIFNAYIVVER